MTRYLTAADIAHERGWHRTTAWRWLRALRKKYGSEIVWDMGGKLVTTAEALARVKETEEAGDNVRMLSRVEYLEAEVADQAKRIDALSKELTEFRRKSHSWYTKGD